MKLMRKVDKVINHKEYFSVFSEENEMRIYFLEENMLRIRVSFNDDWKENSYSLNTVYWEDRMDSLFKDERVKKDYLPYEYKKFDYSHELSNGKLIVRIFEDPFVIEVLDTEGNQLYKSIKDIGFILDSNNRVKNKFEINEDDNFYGFGERGGELNKKSSHIVLNPMDAMGYDPVNTDTLYKHIPFFLRLNNKSKIASGFFYHNTYKQIFDMGRERSNYWHRHATYISDGGDLDIFLMYGPKVQDVIKTYTDLTGKSQLLPKQALGYLASSMYYSELPKNCDEEILNFVDTAISEDIPIDGFQLSSGYCSQKLDVGEKRCVFTWNKERFSDPKDFIEKMNEKNIRVSTNVKPGILTVHPKYQEFEDKNMFLIDKKTNKPAIGTWWGGDGSFIDFTKEEVRESWKGMLNEALFNYGVDSIWNDNCEYDSVIDDDVESNFESIGAPIARNRVVMSNIMCKITNDALLEAYKGRRPFIVCRSGHAGIQRYAQTWSGDNYTSWESLKYNISTILGMALSGVSNYGADVGGFYGPAPNEELFVRWVQNGIFFPRFSIHSTNTDNTVTEPWMYENTKNLVRDAIKLRYRLFPYYYSLMYRSSQSGLPILQPLFAVFQDDENLYNEGFDFMVGDNLLVSNILEEGQKSKKIYFPKGYKFYQVDTRKEYEGGDTYNIDVGLDSIPMFIKEGGIVLSSAKQLYNLKSEHVTDLNILIANGKKGHFVYYEDDGISLDYKKGKFLEETITLEPGEKTYIKFNKTGNYESKVEKIEIDLINKEKSPYYVEIDQREIKHFINHKDYLMTDEGWYYNHSTKSVMIKYKNIVDDYEIMVSFEEFDLVGM